MTYIEFDFLKKQNDKTIRNNYSIISCALCVFTAITVIIQLLISLAIKKGYDTLVQKDWFYIFYADAPMYLGAIWSFLFFMSKLPKVKAKQKKAKIGLGFYACALIICIFFMFSGSIVGMISSKIMDSIFSSDIGDIVGDSMNSISTVASLILSCLIAPIMEELIFRKLILDRTLQYGELGAILFSGITFGMFHGNLQQFFYAFAVGVAFAYVYAKSGKIITTIVLHAILNALFAFIFPAMFSFSESSYAILRLLSALLQGMYLFLPLAGFILLIFLFGQKKISFEKSLYTPQTNSASLAFLNVGFVLFLFQTFFIVISGYLV